MVFDGRKLAAFKEDVLRGKIAQLKMKPKLVAISVGQDPASRIYLDLKQKAAARIGIDFEHKIFPEEAEAKQIIAEIRQANTDGGVGGILVQLPLPKKLEILGAIAPKKDVDCLTPENLGLLMMGQPRFLPATVRGILEILKETGFGGSSLIGKNICVIGGSNIVGKPLALVLSNLGATVTLCRSRTQNLPEFTSGADILVSATGIPNLIKREMVKKEAVVIDVGSPKGDVDFEEVAKIASFITPVPGGVGPMTVASLLENIFEATLASYSEVSS